jgi:hypothetical protein
MINWLISRFPQELLLNEEFTPTGFKIVGDWAFPHRGTLEDKILTPLTY